MKRKISLVMAILLCVTVLLTACGGKTNEGTSGTTGSTTGTTKEAGQTSTSKEPVVIRWATWENRIMAEEMAAKFNEKNPDIIVKIDDFGGWFGNQKLLERAASGDMPDVFNVENPVIPIQNKWMLDMKPYLDKETEKKFYQNFVDTGTFDGKVIMLPSYIYLYGVVVNKSLLEANNIPIPGYDWTLDEFKEIVTKTTKGNTIGTSGLLDMVKHIPAQMNDKLGWGCWDGSKYVLGSEWIYAVDLVADLYAKGVSAYQVTDGLDNPWDKPEGPERDAAFQAQKDAYKKKFGEESDWDVYMKGKAATWFEFTWGIYFDKDPKYSGWDWDFYPFPVKDKGDVSRPGIVCDSLAIYAGCKNPDAAYRFIKYISFDPSSYDDRVDIINNYDKEKAIEKYPEIPSEQFPDFLTFTHIPAINDQSVRDKWCELNKVKPGVKYVLDNMGTGYIDGFKFVPDFDTAYHKTIEKAIREEVLTGKKTAADLAAELEKKANDITAAAIANMKK